MQTERVQTQQMVVRAAYERVLRGRGTRDVLLDAVCGLVRILKSEGAPPEQVVITVKRLCGMPRVPFAGHADPTAKADVARSISEAVISACIKEYFSPPTARDESRAI